MLMFVICADYIFNLLLLLIYRVSAYNLRNCIGITPFLRDKKARDGWSVGERSYAAKFILPLRSRLDSARGWAAMV